MLAIRVYGARRLRYGTIEIADTDENVEFALSYPEINLVTVWVDRCARSRAVHKAAVADLRTPDRLVRDSPESDLQEPTRFPFWPGA